MLLVAGLTALISVNGAVAALVPVASSGGAPPPRRPRSCLLPLAFAAHAGSLLVAHGLARQRDRLRVRRRAGVGSFGFFEFALVGSRSSRARSRSSCSSASGCCPTASPARSRRDFTTHARTLVEQYGLDGSDGAADTPTAAWRRS